MGSVKEARSKHEKKLILQGRKIDRKTLVKY